MNPYYEELSRRRYNYSPLPDTDSCRLVFLKEAGATKRNRTLCRHGRFIWCKGLSYAGRSPDGFRQIQFTVDGGNKLFMVKENNVLCLPSNTYVSNNRYFRNAHKTFLAFSSVFQYQNTLEMMCKNGSWSLDELAATLYKDNPFKAGTLVAPRLGYFYPQCDPPSSADKHTEHPCGIILGRALRDDYIGREFYRVRFGATTYERVHPVQMEVLNEV